MKTFGRLFMAMALALALASGAVARGVIPAAHYDAPASALITTHSKLDHVGASPSGLCLRLTAAGTGERLTCQSGPGPGPVTTAQSEYFRFLNALMEPAALEPLQTGNYVYTVGPNEYKIALQVWYSSLDEAGCLGRFEVRDPHFFLPLRDVTLRGCYNPGTPGLGSHALILNPALASYRDPVSTYYDRVWKLNTRLRTNSVAIDAAPTTNTFTGDTLVLVGAYGGIVTQVTNYDTPYFVIVTPSGQWVNMHDELGDNAQTQLPSAPFAVRGNGVWRFGGRPNLPVSKYTISAARIGPGDPETPGVAAKGSITWVNLPSDWPAVADPTVYTFRDDMIGSSASPLTSLDTGKWTVQDSTGPSGASLNRKFQWYEVVGAGGTYGADGIRSVTTFTRKTGRRLQFDASLKDNSRCAVGWTNTTGSNVADWSHAVVLDTSVGQYKLSVYEDGNLRYSTGAGTVLSKRLQRFQLTMGSAGAVSYQIQSQGFADGGGKLAAPGGPVWHALPVVGSSSATNSLRLMMTCSDGTGYVNDIKVID